MKVFRCSRGHFSVSLDCETCRVERQRDKEIGFKELKQEIEIRLKELEGRGD